MHVYALGEVLPHVDLHLTPERIDEAISAISCAPLRATGVRGISRIPDTHSQVEGAARRGTIPQCVEVVLFLFLNMSSVRATVRVSTRASRGVNIFVGVSVLVVVVLG